MKRPHIEINDNDKGVLGQMGAFAVFLLAAGAIGCALSKLFGG